jgi:hypothetical protein
MNQDSQISKSVLGPARRFSAGPILLRIALFLGCIPLLTTVALAQATVTTYAGNGTRGFGGDGGPAASGSIQGSIQGSVNVTLRHNQGASDPMSVPLPALR